MRPFLNFSMVLNSLKSFVIVVTVLAPPSDFTQELIFNTAAAYINNYFFTFGQIIKLILGI